MIQLLFSNTLKIYINGIGDFPIQNIQVIDDPCPPYAKNLPNEENEENIGKQKKKKKRTLKQTERIIYAPNSNLGYLNYEKSGGYITIPDKHVIFTKLDKPQGGTEKGEENEGEVHINMSNYSNRLQGERGRNSANQCRRGCPASSGPSRNPRG